MMRHWIAILLMSLLTLGSGAAPSRADDAPKKPGAAKNAEHKEPSQGEKVMDSLFGKPKALIDLGIWTLVVFFLLLFVLGRFAWKPLIENLQKRETNIQEAKELAEKARAEAEELRKQFQIEMDHASQKAASILEDARNDAKRTTDEIIAKAREEIQTDRARLRREIETAKDQALQEIWTKTAELAAAVSSKAIQRQLTADDHRQLVDEAINELQQRA